MLLGVFIAAMISAFVPEALLAEHLGGGMLSMLAMMLFGIPVYVCATASVPIAAALIAKGVSPGAALVFLMTPGLAFFYGGLVRASNILNTMMMSIISLGHRIAKVGQ